MILEERNKVIIASEHAQLWNQLNVMKVHVKNPIRKGDTITIPAGSRLVEDYRFVHSSKALYTDEEMKVKVESVSNLDADSLNVDFPMTVIFTKAVKGLKAVYVNEEMLEANGIKLAELNVEIHKVTTLDTTVRKAKDIR